MRHAGERGPIYFRAPVECEGHYSAVHHLFLLGVVDSLLRQEALLVPPGQKKVGSRQKEKDHAGRDQTHATDENGHRRHLREKATRDKTSDKLMAAGREGTEDSLRHGQVRRIPSSSDVE